MIIFSPLFQVYILVLMIALELVKEWWMQDYVVSVITLHFGAETREESATGR
jgi:hypothetical protein